MPDTEQRLADIEKRIGQIEQVLVALGYQLYGWGIHHFSRRFLRPGKRRGVDSGHLRESPFDAIAHLFKFED